jgi:histidinol-phosphate aminotransferase
MRAPTMSERRFAPFLRADLAELRSYQPLPGTFEVRLDGNEPPPLLTPDAAAALSAAMVKAPFNRYPDAHATELRAAIAEAYGARPEEVLAGVGSDEVIALLLTALDRPQGKNPEPTIVTPSPTFVMYRLSARARGFKVIEVPLDDAWDLDVRGMVRAVEFAQPNIVFIASPNNPTSRLMSLDRLEAFLAATPGPLVVLDEAYVDFAPRNQRALREKYPNVALLGTLSKVGFAALRVGWMIGPPELVSEVDKVRQPYNLPVPSQRGATYVLQHLRDEMTRMAGVVKAERDRLATALTGLGFDVTPSDANFLWIAAKGPAEAVAQGLSARGVLIKSFHASGGRLARRVRITVGLAQENDRLLDEIARCV